MMASKMDDSELARQVLQFVPFSSMLDAGFWHTLCDRKLNHYGLDDQVQPLFGCYTNSDAVGVPCRLSLDLSSFEKETKVPHRHMVMAGDLHNKNTLNDFKLCNKQEILDKTGQAIWQSIISGEATVNPGCLSRFLLLTFAELKKYDFYYWFGFPALCFLKPFTLLSDIETVSSHLSIHQIKQLHENLHILQISAKPKLSHFVIVVDPKQQVTVHLLSEVTPDLLQLSDSRVIFTFCDPSTLGFPGWPLRNFLAYIACNWGQVLCNEVMILCYREKLQHGLHNCEHSLLLKVGLPDVDKNMIPKFVGWEVGKKQKPAPRFVNLSRSMDPVMLADSAVDLNLQLMKWRILPDLNLKHVTSTKCLLLGAGTLGCNVARCLMGWGIRNITFVDNGKVSYSNPVRQTLFDFNDCTSGKNKSVAAADCLQKIFPGMSAKGIVLSIPMPGHSVSVQCQDQVQSDVTRLEALIQEHDVTFLLLDTREARWLPTLLGAKHGKIIMNVALGFDSWLVMRHGKQKNVDSAVCQMDLGSGDSCITPQRARVSGTELGCYFCNNVVAPRDSTVDRTLDQQCTVTRPGLSMIASGFAVELLVALLQHPKGAEAAADTGYSDDVEGSSLGLVPHQMRGFLGQFHHVIPSCKMFDQCTACSKTVLDAFERDGFGFLMKVFNDPTYLEELTGLSKLQEDALVDDMWELDSDESG